MNFKLNIIVPVLFILVVGSFVAFSFRSNTSNPNSIGSQNYDGTYSGKLNYEYKVYDWKAKGDGCHTWIPASFDLTITVKDDEITHVYSSEPAFGTGSNGVVPIVDRTTVTLGGGGIIRIGFPNGTFLALESGYFDEKDSELLTSNPLRNPSSDNDQNYYWFWRSGGKDNTFSNKTVSTDGPEEWCSERSRPWSLRKVSS